MVEHFFKNIQQLFIFSKKAPKQMFEWVLNISLVSVKNKQTNYLTWKNENFMAFFWDGVQLCQGYRATMRRQFTFYHLLPRSGRMKGCWTANPGQLAWDSTTLTTTIIGKTYVEYKCWGFINIKQTLH